MRTSSRNLALVLFDEVEVLDVAGPLQVFTVVGRQWNWRPFRVLAVSDRARTIATRNQVTLSAELGFDACPTPDVIVVPGGYGARPANELLDAWLREHGARAEALIGIGNGVLPLARAGLCDHRTIATSPESRSEVAAAAPSASLDDGRRVVRSDRLVTAASSAAAIDAALVAVSALLGEKQATATARAIDHPWAAEDGAPAPLRIEITSGDGER